MRGSRYCDLLLSVARSELRGRARTEAAFPACIREVQDRAAQTLEWAQKQGFLLDIALDHLSLGRALLLEAEYTTATTTTAATAAATPAVIGLAARAVAELDRAVHGLRQAGTEHHLPRGLLARAGGHRLAAVLAARPAAPLPSAAGLAAIRTGLDQARADLDEARAIAERASMPLFLADIALERARLALARSDIARARDHADTARAIIATTGYHRRIPDLAAIDTRTGR